jgi:Gram-negative bacterial TonB protein C-terminal
MRNSCTVLALSLLVLAPANALAQDSGQPLPKLVSHADAVYPAIARAAHVMGDVVVKITTDGQSVVDAVAESGPPLLCQASVDNAKTWKFEPHIPGTFHVTFRYKISAGDAAASFPGSPGNVEVEVAALPSTIQITWAWAELGKWKAELKSPHGRLAKVFEFSYSGPHGEWLDVGVPGSPTDDTDDDTDERANDDEFTHKDGDFLAFAMKLAEPDGRLLETYLIGKMSGDKIVGTFMDESGVRGTWSATRIRVSEKK